MELYHFRSIDSAIYEIKDNTLHFASPREVNDPIDGHAGIYWQGDCAAWEGLLRNYVCSLYHTIELYLLAADQNTLIRECALFDIHCFDELPLGAVLKEVGNNFLQLSNIRKVIERYGTDSRKCYAKELKTILNFVHSTAMRVCLEDMHSHGILPQEEYERVCPSKSRHEEQIWSLSEGMDCDYLESIFGIMGDFTDDAYEMGCIKIALKQASEAKHNPDVVEPDYSMPQKWLSIYIDFPAMYIRQLQDMIFPQGYITCFSANRDDSVMWGNYADRHRGVCLVYQPQEDGNRQIIPIKRHGRYIAHEVRKMEYDGTPVLRNFFDSLGCLTSRALSGWLTGMVETSSYHAKYENSEQWRSDYWHANDEKFFHKLSEWKYECEYRVLITDMLGFYKDVEEKKRNFEFEPSVLTGVIFGAETTVQDKIRIFEAIQATGRSYKLFQAEYDDKVQKITIRPKHHY